MENIIIIGAGPAGISAALYAARGNLTPLLLNNGIGALAKAEKIENYYGLERPLSGEELYERGVAQAKALGIRIIDAQVLGINGFDTFTVQTTAGNFDTVSVILATGGKRSAPNIPGIREFEGKGVSYCAICDAFFYRNRDVAVIGNSDFALHEAEELRNVTSSVTIYTNGREPEFSREHPIAVNTMKIQAIEGGDTVSGIRMEHDVASMENEDRESFYPADGVFVALGTAGSTEIARQMGAELTDKGNVRVNSEMETTIPGLFAAGDCTGGLLQVSKAVYQLKNTVYQFIQHRINIMATTITSQNFEEEVLKSEKPILLDFWATWCGPCMRQGPIVEALAEEGYNVGKIDVDQEMGLAQQFKVMSIPTLLIFKGGQEVHRLVGLTSKEDLKKLLDE